MTTLWYILVTAGFLLGFQVLVTNCEAKCFPLCQVVSPSYFSLFGNFFFKNYYLWHYSCEVRGTPGITSRISSMFGQHPVFSDNQLSRSDIAVWIGYKYSGICLISQAVNCSPWHLWQHWKTHFRFSCPLFLLCPMTQWCYYLLYESFKCSGLRGHEPAVQRPWKIPIVPTLVHTQLIQ